MRDITIIPKLKARGPTYFYLTFFLIEKKTTTALYFINCNGLIIIYHKREH